jgi:hypothetical protein
MEFSKIDPWMERKEKLLMLGQLLLLARTLLGKLARL